MYTHTHTAAINATKTPLTAHAALWRFEVDGATGAGAASGTRNPVPNNASLMAELQPPHSVPVDCGSVPVSSTTARTVRATVSQSCAEQF